MSGLDMSGALKLQKQLQQLEKEFDLFIRRFLLTEALEALAEARARTPAEADALRRSWTIAGGQVEAGVPYPDTGKAALDHVQRVGDTLLVALSNSAAEASAVEYGHLTDDRKGWAEGKFMCTLAIDEVARRMPPRFQRAFAEWLRR